jgi:glycosyltransferase involved in cell wall biosynthesis
MSPRISVVMLTYNRPQFIQRAIESVAAQTCRDWEVLVIHDGPNRQTAEIVECIGRREPRVRYFHRVEPGNIADATNFGLEHARGEFIAILDDDDYWIAAHKLERQMEFLNCNPEYVGCGGGVVVVDQQGRETMRYLKPLSDLEIKRRALIANPMAHSTTLYRRSAAERCGGYDTSLAGFQDWDFWLKMGQIGKLVNFPEYLTAYQIWEGGGSFQAQRSNTRSALAIVRRHRREYPGFLAGYSLAAAYYSYALLPMSVKKASFSFLSRMKKAVFSARGTKR